MDHRRNSDSESASAFDAGTRPVPARIWQGGPPVSTGLRLINIVLGVWLVLSAFAWPHTGPSLVNTLIVGALYSLAAATAASQAIASRSMCSVLALWLLVSTLLITPRTSLTFWHNLTLGAVALLLMLMPSARMRGPSPA